MIEVEDAVAQGVERREDRRRRDLGPGPLDLAVLEQRPLGGQPPQERVGLTTVAVGAQVVLAQGVRHDQDDTLRRLPGAGLPAPPRRLDHGRAPEAESAGARSVEREGQIDLPPFVVAQVDRHRLPPPGIVHPVLGQHLVSSLPARGTDADAERHRRLLDGADGQGQARAPRSPQRERDPFGRVGDQRLVVDLGQALPTDPGVDPRQMVGPGHQPNRLDLDLGVLCVRRTEQEVADRSDVRAERVVVRVQDIGSHAGPGDDRGGDPPRHQPALGYRTLEVDLFGRRELHRQVGPCRRTHPHFHAVQKIVAARLLPPVEREHRKVVDGAPHQPAVVDLRAPDPRARIPGRIIRRAVEPPLDRLDLGRGDAVPDVSLLVGELVDQVDRRGSGVLPRATTAGQQPGQRQAAKGSPPRKPGEPGKTDVRAAGRRSAHSHGASFESGRSSRGASELTHRPAPLPEPHREPPLPTCAGGGRAAPRP